MACRYCVVQYVPDVVADERINIGVIVFDEQQTQVGFLNNWERVQRFTNEDIGFLRQFADDMKSAASSRMALPDITGQVALVPEQIRRMSERWHNSIQITTPRASLETINETFSDAFGRFLRQRNRSHRDYRNRRSAAALARASVRGALNGRVGRVNSELYLQPQATLAGRRKLHIFDGVVVNENPSYAVQGLSFELPEARQLNMQIDALAFAVVDVREADPDLPIGIVALKPHVDSPRSVKKLHSDSIKMYGEIGADILTENNVDDWAERMAQRIPVPA